MNPNKADVIHCSVGILTKNSVATLERTLNSLSRFDDIIVCDGTSTDGTRKVASKYHAQLIDQDPTYLDQAGKIIDYAGVRNQTLDAATNSWFLFVDSDEYISKGLADAIQKTITNDERAAYFIYREYELHGERIMCASTYPTKNMRFFHKESVTHFIKPVHERIEVRDTAHVRDLPRVAPLIVPIRDTPAESRRKNRRYIQLELERIDSLSPLEWLRKCLRRFFSSGKLFFKMLRSLLFCKGKSLPFAHEMNRHWYNAVLSYHEFSLISWRKRSISSEK